MRCPRCGSSEHDRYRPPVQQSDTTLRRHKCRGCGLLFLSAQVAVTGPLVGRLLPLLAR